MRTSAHSPRLNANAYLCAYSLFCLCSQFAGALLVLYGGEKIPGGVINFRVLELPIFVLFYSGAISAIAATLCGKLVMRLVAAGIATIYVFVILVSHDVIW